MVIFSKIPWWFGFQRLCPLQSRNGWGIGNGDRISIIKDNWVPGFRAGTFKPLSPIPATAKVRYLMNSEGNGREVDTVKATRR
jgi:hypothetical protein